MARLRIIALLIFSVLSISAVAQFRVDTSYQVSALVNDVLLGSGIQADNVTLKGHKRAIAYFDYKNPIPDVPRGILLTTGNSFKVTGPNNTTSQSSGNHQRGDMLLQRISGGKTYDAVILEFDFIPQTDSLHFNFFFASEEYTEYVNSGFNDVFAFHIQGPGYTTPKNLAVLPHNGKPITVNNVNIVKNKRFYLDNYCWDRSGMPSPTKIKNLNPQLLKNIQFDGLTTILTAFCKVKPGESYHIRIGIADVGDSRYDSAVFLQAGSFSSAPPEQRALAIVQARDPNFVRDSLPTPNLGNLEPQDSIPSDLPSGVDKPPVTYTVYFDFDKHALDSEAKQRIEAAYQVLKYFPDATIRIDGHTDSKGSRSYNQRLSKRRANSVLQALINRGIPSGKIMEQGFSFDKPKVPNNSDQNRAKNRRVEIYIE